VPSSNASAEARHWSAIFEAFYAAGSNASKFSAVTRSANCCIVSLYF